jgi:hypothetical protein
MKRYLISRAERINAAMAFLMLPTHVEDEQLLANKKV